MAVAGAGWLLNSSPTMTRTASRMPCSPSLRLGPPPGSVRSSLSRDQQRKSITTTKGSATRIVALWSDSSPPATSRAAATDAIRSPQVTTSQRRGCRAPLLVSEPMTREAESALVTKYIMIRIIAVQDVTALNGRPSSIANSVASVPSFAFSAMSTTPVSARRIPVPPSTTNHRAVAPLGTSSTARRNSRIVRPREMRARKVPTKGAQDSHQAQ
ncbi:hypothetical protein SBADM41S_04596 [Streptomyces badius]